MKRTACSSCIPLANMQDWSSQRAFRERKERRVRDLEQKLTDLQAQSMTLHADNERLKRELAKVATENEILRATSATTPTNTSHGDYAGSEEDEASTGKRTTSAPPPTINGPKKFPSLDVRKNYANILKTGALPHRIVLSAETGDRLLDARATWDFIQNHPLFKQGLVDIGDVCERLKTFTKCDGQGPVFEEGRVRKVIEESVASGNDELIWWRWRFFSKPLLPQKKDWLIEFSVHHIDVNCLSLSLSSSFRAGQRLDIWVIGFIEWLRWLFSALAFMRDYCHLVCDFSPTPKPPPPPIPIPYLYLHRVIDNHTIVNTDSFMSSKFLTLLSTSLTTLIISLVAKLYACNI